MRPPRLVEFRSGEAEIAIRYSVAASCWPRTEAKHLIDVLLTPVITPSLLASGPPISSPSDLRHYTLLHDVNRDGWAQWFQAAGFPDLALQRGPIYADTALVLQAAKLGHGIALGDRAMERDDLRLGNLVRPLDIEVPCGAYWLVAPSFGRLSRPAKAFAEWVEAEFAVAPPVLGRD